MKATLLPWIEKQKDKIDWNYFSHNDNAIHFLEKNPDKVDWSMLSSNINAIPILEKNQHNIYWKVLCKNPNICCCDYDYYKKRMDIHREELMKKVFHPRRLAYYLELEYDMFD